VDLHGKIVLPDGSPAVGYSISLSGEARNPYSTPHTSFHAQTGTGEEGTFQIEVVPGTLELRVFAPEENARFTLKPFKCIAQEDMEPLNITLEEGIPVRGRCVYENAAPAADHQVYFAYQVETEIDMPEIPHKSTITRSHYWSTRTNDNGEYTAYLLPGEYTVRHQTTYPHPLPGEYTEDETKITIAATDTEKQLDLTFPTPIFVETELADGSPVKQPVHCWFPDGENYTGSQAAIKMDGSFLFESATKEGTLYITTGGDGKYGTIEKITPEMFGTTQRFQLKPLESATVTLVDADNKPMVGRQVWLAVQETRPGNRTFLGASSQADTDAEGKATLFTFPGKRFVSLHLPGRSERAFLGTYGNDGYRIAREIDLAPGDTFDFGTIKLIRVFGKLPRGNIQINEMLGPDAPRHQDKQMVGHLWPTHGESEILLPPGYYRLGPDFVLTIGEEDKEIQIDFDADGQGGNASGGVGFFGVQKLRCQVRRLSQLTAYIHYEPRSGEGVTQGRPNTCPAFGYFLDHEHLHAYF
jgi:hypothetical protein